MDKVYLRLPGDPEVNEWALNRAQTIDPDAKLYPSLGELGPYLETSSEEAKMLAMMCIPQCVPQSFKLPTLSRARHP